MPTGLGKTLVAAHLPSYVGMQRRERMLFLAHRKDLVRQSADKFRQINPNLRVTIDRAQYLPDPNAEIVIGSTATLGMLNEGDPDLFSERLLKYDRDSVKYIQLDEVHTSVASETHLQILRYFRAYKAEPENNDPSKLLIGYTATPNRPDGIGLDTIFDKIAFGDTYGLKEAIRDGWLARVTGYRIETDISLDNVKMRHGDFQTSDLENTVNTPERNRLIVEKYKELGNGRPAIGFTVDVMHSHDLANEFNRQGIVAAPISGPTSDVERMRLYRAFVDREIAVLLSCGVLSVGWDCPAAEVALMCRPTRSNLWYIQAVGRVLRPYPAPEEKLKPIKEKAVVLDFCDLCHRHKLMSIPSLFGLNPDFDLRGSDAVRTIDEIEELQEAKQLSLAHVRNMQELRSMVEHIDLLAAPEVPEEIKSLSRFAWLTGINGYRLTIPGRIVLSVRENSLGKYSVYKNVDGTKQAVYDGIDSLESSIKLADQLVPNESKRVLMLDAGWRSEKPTDKQIAALARLDKGMVAKFGSFGAFEEFMMSNFSRGQLSSMISDRHKN
jgi:superfamily II DNA or RNA helicase